MSSFVLLRPHNLTSGACRIEIFVGFVAAIKFLLYWNRFTFMIAITSIEQMFGWELTCARECAQLRHGTEVRLSVGFRA